VWVNDLFSKILRKKSIDESITQSIRNQSITPIINQSLNQSEINQSPAIEPEKDIRLQKDALELGLAAGYAGRSLHSIESSLERLESVVATKDWLSERFNDLMAAHETNEQKRFETIVSILSSLYKITEKAPLEIKPELKQITRTIEAQTKGNLTPRMMRLIQAVKQEGEISYRDLAPKLFISEDCLRGLVSIVLRKSNDIEKFEKEGKGWLRQVSQVKSSVEPRIQYNESITDELGDK
jgi:hypothetical protein